MTWGWTPRSSRCRCPRACASRSSASTFARLLKLRVEEKVIKSEDRHESNVDIEQGRITQYASNADGKEVVRRAANDGGMLWVFTFEDIVEFIKTAVKDGWLNRAGMRINEQPVYKVVAREAEESQADYFAWAAPTGELLFAKTLEQLQEMISAGLGLSLGLLDDNDYMDLFPYITDLGQSWSIEPMRVRVRMQIDLWSQYPDLDPQVRELEENMETGRLYEIESYEFRDDSIAVSSIKIYGDEEKAEAEAAKVNAQLGQAASSLKESRKETMNGINEAVVEGEGRELSQREKQIVNRALGFAGNLIEGQETTVDGPVVKTVITFGERQLSTLKFLMGVAKAFEEKEKNKDNDEDEEH